jgi:hypothetical protein
MSANKYSITITPYEHSILSENTMISMLFREQLQSAVTYENDDGEEELELSMTLTEFEDFIGYVAAESNHAGRKRLGEDLGELYDYLESQVYFIKRNQ